MNGERFLAVEDGQLVKYSELASLIALALHPSDGDEFSYAAARINLESDLAKAAHEGRLVVRNPMGLGRHPLPYGNALRRAVLLPNDLRPFLEERGIELRLTPHGDGPFFWTLDNTAIALAEQEGWHNGTRGSFLDRLVEAAVLGELRVRDPRSEMPYRPKVVRTFWEVVTPLDVNVWLEKQGASYRWNVETATTSDIQYVCFSDAATTLNCSDELALQKMAVDGAAAHVLYVSEVLDGSGDKAGSVKCCPPLSTVEFAELRANGSVEVSGTILLQRLPAMGWPAGTLDDEVLRRVFGLDGTFAYERRLKTGTLRVKTADLLVAAQDVRRLAMAQGLARNLRPVEPNAETLVITAPRNFEKRSDLNDAKVLDALRSLGFDPKQLPSAPPGKSSPAKAAAKAKVVPMTVDMFKRSWQRLLDSRELVYAQG